MSESEPIWTCKDGRKIPAAKLEEEHLVNIIKMWRRNVQSYRFIVEHVAFHTSPNHNIEVNQDFLGGEEGMLLELEDDDFLRAAFPRFDDLLWECISRGLMDGDSGEWLRKPEPRRMELVDIERQLEIARRIKACGVLV